MQRKWLATAGWTLLLVVSTGAVVEWMLRRAEEALFTPRS